MFTPFPLNLISMLQSKSSLSVLHPPPTPPQLQFQCWISENNAEIPPEIPVIPTYPEHRYQERKQRRRLTSNKLQYNEKKKKVRDFWRSAVCPIYAGSTRWFARYTPVDFQQFFTLRCSCCVSEYKSGHRFTTVIPQVQVDIIVEGWDLFAHHILPIHIKAEFQQSNTLIYLDIDYWTSTHPVSILYKSITGRYRPGRVADGPIMARYRFVKNASWERYTYYFTLNTSFHISDHCKPGPSTIFI